jgi:hypothetical protein
VGECITLYYVTDIYSLRIGLPKIALYTPSPWNRKQTNIFEFNLFKFMQKKQKTVSVIIHTVFEDILYILMKVFVECQLYLRTIFNTFKSHQILVTLK